MKYIILTNGEKCKVDDAMYLTLSRHNWYKHTCGYAVTTISDGNSKYRTVLMHRMITRATIGDVVDHKNLNKLDNRISNLRFCTMSQNHANKAKMKNNKSGFKGIYWDKTRKLWRARINFNKKEIYLGRYKELKDAIQAYNIGASKFFGEFARINYGY